MRIGILTFHLAHNYGAALQCYALTTYLSELKHEVCIIDYRPNSINQNYKWFNWKRIWTRNPFLLMKNLLFELFVSPKRKKRYDSFILFQNRFFKCEPISTICEKPYDLIIVGSDQIWNTNLTDGFDKYYWGEFGKPKHTKIVSYAASMEDNIPTAKVKDIYKRLKNFQYISVREKSTVSQLKRFCNDLEIYWCVDPTFLLSSEKWSSFGGKSIIKDPYLFFYQAERSEKAEKIAKRISVELGLCYVDLSVSVINTHSKQTRYANPIDFVTLCKHATFIVCNSFHCTVFSILFNKPFVSIKNNKGKDSRVSDILESYGLQGRFITEYHKGEASNILGSNNAYTSIAMNMEMEDSKKYLNIVLNYERQNNN